MSDYPPSSLAYPLLNQLLDSLLPLPVSSTSSTFTLSTMDTSSSLSVASSSFVSSTSPLQPPPSSLLVTTTPSLQITVLSSLLHPVLMTASTLPLHPQDVVATSPNLQQYSAVRQLTHDLQIKKPRHPRRPQLPSHGIGPPVRRLVHTAVYKQKLAQYIDALKMYETHLDELIYQTTLELDNINNKPPSKLRKFKSPQFKNRPLSPLNIQIPSHNCSNYNNYIQCTTPHCSHVPVRHTSHSPLPPPPSLFPPH